MLKQITPEGVSVRWRTPPWSFDRLRCSRAGGIRMYASGYFTVMPHFASGRTNGGALMLYRRGGLTVMRGMAKVPAWDGWAFNTECGQLVQWYGLRHAVHYPSLMLGPHTVLFCETSLELRSGPALGAGQAVQLRWLTRWERMRAWCEVRKVGARRSTALPELFVYVLPASR